MGRVFCERCGQPASPDESLVVSGRLLCRECVGATAARGEELPKESSVDNADASVCSNCGKYVGDTEPARLLSLPVCGTCLSFFRNRPFPSWVRTSFLGLIAIVVLTIFWNARFILAYVELKQMGGALVSGDIDRAASLATSMADRVPESAELRSIADYHQGIVLLREEKCREALAKFEACRDGMPPEFRVDLLILHARMGAAFNDADYDAFLEAAQEMLKAFPKDAVAMGSVASAYACKYAQTGNEAFRKKSLEVLQEAKSLGPPEEFSEYEMRIRHRLQTREIIDREEFVKRFPNGWPPKER